MNIFEPVKMGLEQLRVHKMRAFLSILGILISVGSVTGIVSIGEGLQVTILDQFEQSGGPNMITIRPPDTWYRNDGGQWVRRDWEEHIQNRDLDYIAEHAENVDFVVPINFFSLNVSYRDVSASASVSATNEHYLAIQNYHIDKGRNINTQDVKGAAKVAVLGSELAEDLFGDENPVGREIKLEGIRFEVVGVLSPSPMLMGNSNSRVLIGPYTTGQLRFTGDDQLNRIIVRADTPDNVDAVVHQIGTILKHYHEHGADFRVQSGQDSIEQFNRIMFILKAIAGGIAGISLLVGGIGIMNIMLVSVTERTREIGIRKALGAKSSSILSQFILEAIVLCLFGGGLGIVLGLGLGAGIAQIIKNLSGEPFVSIITPGLMAFAILYSSLIGLFFGVYPAWRAARLDPIEALRYE